MLSRAASLVLRGAKQAPAVQQLARNFAAAATAKNELKLPVAPLQLSGTSGQIATLAWQVASKENILEKVQDELHQMVEVFTQHEQIRRLATDPFVPAVVRVKLLQTVLKDSGATEVTKRLFEALAEENSLKAVLEVTNAYDELMLAHKKEVHCSVITAQPLDKMERIEFKKQAEQFVEPGFKLVLKEKIDKKLLGGFVIEFEDRRVDMSTAKKLEEFQGLVTKLENDLK